jgi:NO-binding membrane sensor protein with MHYT domain
VVIFYEVLLVSVAVLIAWFSLYVVYRLISDESNLRRR